jgi:hypothetical protein
VDGAGLKHLDRAIAIAEKSYGEQSAPVLGMTANRALFLTNQGRYDEALEQSRRALARAEKGVGPEHTVVGLLHQGMGKAHAAKGELAPRAPPTRERAPSRSRPSGPTIRTTRTR